MTVYFPIQESIEDLKSSSSYTRWDLEDLLGMINAELLALKISGKSSKSHNLIRSRLEFLINSFETLTPEELRRSIEFIDKLYASIS